MPAFSSSLTPYPDVNAILNELLASAREILGTQFVGMYLGGSLALGEFQYGTSDIDFLIVVNNELSDAQVHALQALHEHLSKYQSKWGHELEGAYIPLAALRRYDPTNATHPHIERGGSLRAEQHYTDWVIQRYIFRERGIIIVGPPPRELIDPIAPNELRAAMIELFDFWWAPMIDEPARLRHPGYQVYAILTMCRILYTLEHGTITSKPDAGRWVQEKFGERWRALIESALTWRNGMPHDRLEETRALIHFTRDSRYA